MVNFLFNAYRETLLDSSAPDLSSVDVRVILYDAADDTPNQATDDFLDDIAAGARVAVSAATLGSQTVTDGTFDAADETFSSVTGDQSEGLIIYYHTGTDSTSPLIAHFDTGVTGLPVTPNGGDITVTWNGSGIFSVGG